MEVSHSASRLHYSEDIKLINIAMTIPVTTAGNERLFCIETTEDVFASTDLAGELTALLDP